MTETPSRGPKSAWWSAVVYLLLWGIVDWRTGSELSLSVFYLPAVAWVAWRHGRLQAVLVSFLAGIVWLAAELGTGAWGGVKGLLLWNAAVRFGFFCITGVLVSEVRIRQAAERQLKAQGAMLGKILDALEDGVVVMDPGCRLILANPAASEVFRSVAGTDRPDDWWKCLRDLHAGGDKLPPSPWEVPGVRDRHGARLEFSIESPKTEGERRFEMEIEAIDNKDRNPSCLVMVSRDRTERYLLEKRITEITELEKRQIGQEIHDGLCQQLAALAFGVAAWQAELEGSGRVEMAGVADRLAREVKDAIRLARDISHGLFPAGMEDGLDSGLRILAEKFQGRAGFDVRYEPHAQDIPLSQESSIHLYRIAQEAVTNSIRHSGGSTVIIRLATGPDGLELSVEDDGSGLPPVPPGATGIGLAIMRHRASIIHSRLEIESTAGKGTRVRCRMPLHHPADGERVDASVDAK